MRAIYLAMGAAVLAAGAAHGMAQQRATSAPAATDQGQTTAVSPGQAAVDRAAAAHKYVFLFFWKEKGQSTDSAWSAFQAASAKLAASADAVSIRIADAAEKKLVEKYGVGRAPMPLVLAVAPCGAITKAFTKTFDEKQLRTAFVSPATQLCLKALQSRKLVFVCVVERADPKAVLTIPKGVEDFRADAKYASVTEIVLVDAQDAGEATLLKELEIKKETVKPVTVFLGPPGALIGKFGGDATKKQFVAKLAAAQSGCCPGGKCGPGGCGPKK
jgi:hypothetical protein